jgi:hypothetical protein
MLQNVICWLYTYTDDNIDGIIIIKKNSSDDKKYMLYYAIDNNSIESIRKLIQEESNESNDEYEYEYSEDNLKILINNTFT